VGGGSRARKLFLCAHLPAVRRGSRGRDIKIERRPLRRVSSISNRHGDNWGRPSSLVVFFTQIVTPACAHGMMKVLQVAEGLVCVCVIGHFTQRAHVQHTSLRRAQIIVDGRWRASVSSCSTRGRDRLSQTETE